MKKSLVLFVFTALSALTGCQNAAPPVKVEKVPSTPAPASSAPKVDEHGHVDDAPRITIAEAKKEFDAGNIVFVDTRAEAAFNGERIKGAVSVPEDAPDSKYSTIPKGKKIVAYCS
jgi:hypothetical protein